MVMLWSNQYLSQVGRRVGKEVESENEKDEDEEADGASNSGHVSVHRRCKPQSAVAVSSKPRSIYMLE